MPNATPTPSATPKRTRTPRNKATLPPSPSGSVSALPVPVAVTALAPKPPRPLPPSLVGKPVLQTSDEVQQLVLEGDFDLGELGQSCTCALGLLSALLEHMTHKRAFEKSGLRWSTLGMFRAWCPDYDRLYRLVLVKLEETRVLVLRDEAFEWAAGHKKKGIYHDGKRIDEEVVHSDKMHDLLLRGLDPQTFGRVGDTENKAPIILNINV